MDTYLVKLGELFSLLNHFGLKLNAKKTSLYQTQVKWCGKLIDGQGIRHDPERINSLRALPYPCTAGELQQFICAINWMRDSIIDFARQVEPLQRRLDTALASTRRTKRAAANIAIELTVDERRAFDQVKDALANAITLDFPDDTSTTCLLTEASDVGYAIIVTQHDLKMGRQPYTNGVGEAIKSCATATTACPSAYLGTTTTWRRTFYLAHTCGTSE
ncbi:RNA-directed DNA polymerase [Phytophthora megakarya]|uniref:RNA-directed DNA polymerase n=1 Tax=Phytophthora megakarya TaxID=4795 RepID=A0A225W776_9STRA|nr:RNA-directed DNA polymerase [Phytophthora megakarya]